ncbi:MAG: protein-glutamate O-methyltransferase CheR [Chromatiaceae bacterium]|nr:protein-glutamate O-methyltransferase CheR [Gammaproteobacteria bacterium]MCP5427287.1 protein-glutamate O-methyltransferase CheR [Chromatiaceae bacterium]MCB1862220.1 protein-glutamate O-methyltransferase CheR [Gammaproteobacteria bacterium]MCB1871037.1 protein-glutamate O-methyltransferase CheR [Gammaproteobacteria bacterium]MCB1879962.1 protein-glutamate O-methyltransferase CheR [Gammaproteobacteria bacterium]
MHETSVTKGILSHGDYEAFQQFLQQACGIVLGAGKEYLVSSRLGGLMRHYDIATVGELLNQLHHGRNPSLKTGIIDAMTTNETFWFRDMAHFNLLQQRILPELCDRSASRIRIWSAACSSGQEPYNISMVVEEFLARNRGRFNAMTEIVATDISQRILEAARRGIYCGMSASRGLSAEQSKRYFVRTGDCLEVRPEIKRRVSFRNANLTQGYELLGRFDIIFCRNVLIYFSRTQKQEILTRMARILNPGGYLLLGSTESLSGHSDQFDMISESGGIIYRLK